VGVPIAVLAKWSQKVLVKLKTLFSITRARTSSGSLVGKSGGS
jgi:hypothetical protein